MKVSSMVAAAGLVLALAADAFLLLANTYHGSACATTADGQYACRDTSATLLQQNGEGVLIWLALPTLLAAVLLGTTFSSFKRRRLVAWIADTVLVGFCLLTGFSIGVFFVATALLCVIAAVVDPPTVTQTPG